MENRESGMRSLRLKKLLMLGASLGVGYVAGNTVYEALAYDAVPHVTGSGAPLVESSFYRVMDFFNKVAGVSSGSAFFGLSLSLLYEKFGGK
jgi:hypothetical protein